MTREEAIKMLKSKMDGHTDTSYEWAETVRMAIKALEQEPSGDLISRKAVNNLQRYRYNCGDTSITCISLKSVNELPPVEQEPKYCDRNICIKNDYNGIGCDECEVTKSQEPKTGHWIHFATSDDCSECGWSTGKYISPSKFCPNCGARMVEQESEEV